MNEGSLPLAFQEDSIPPGTRITMQHWENYKQFMPDGMIWLFEGKYFWKMPPDVEINVGPTVIHPLPKAYREATERYSRQVEISELPDGALSLRGYRGGQPFPNPADPHKGWKILANVWYRYLPPYWSAPRPCARRTSTAAFGAATTRSSIASSVRIPTQRFPKPFPVRRGSSIPSG